ncbi:hypothetical protein [Tepidibacter hydrothermalis]|uniref:Uncharacterized protein n=1 Tax=Tepidibacter hydrothermalis TaxID=3036126 RepID=A0ABY8EEI9_9FIRM|nr:hypothetical protein [Tepidibacter hydrothermalis]WFD11360.1 hypothetical protein P4S50_04590 [Tepidibacter hydrothermalis]
MKKFTAVFIFYVLFFCMNLNIYQNKLINDINNINPYIRETNFIVEDFNHNRIKQDNIDEYIKRIDNLKSGLSSIEDTKSIELYVDYKKISLEKLKKAINNRIYNKEKLKRNINEYNTYNRLSQDEIQKKLKKTLIRVTKLDETS